MNFEFMTIDTPLPPCMPFPRTGFPVSSSKGHEPDFALLSKWQEDENGCLSASLSQPQSCPAAP